MLKPLITGPAVNDPGGVSAFFSTIAPHLARHDTLHEYLEVGSTRGRILHPVSDQLAFRQCLRKSQFDLVQINPSFLRRSFVRDGLFAYQAKTHGMPLLVFFHGWSSEFAENLKQYRMRFFHATYGQADAFIVLDSAVKEKLLEFGIGAPISLGTTAIDDKLIANFDFDATIADRQNNDEFILLFLARLEAEKGIYETIDACELLRQNNRSVRLIVAGDGPNANPIKEYGRAKLGESVEFTGYVSGNEKAALLRKANGFVMPSYSEGMPIAVLEAMAFGLPIVTRMVGGLKDILVDGEHGYLTESKKPEVIASLIEKLIAQPERTQSLSHNVHELARKKFTASAVAKTFSQVLRNTHGKARTDKT